MSTTPRASLDRRALAILWVVSTARDLLTSITIFTVGRVVLMLLACGGRTGTGIRPVKKVLGRIKGNQMQLRWMKKRDLNYEPENNLVQSFFIVKFNSLPA